MYEQGRQGILLLQQNLCALDLYGTVHAAVSTFDTLNHIGPYAQFERAVCQARCLLSRAGVCV